MDKEARRTALLAQLNRTSLQAAIALAITWLFVVFSYLLTRKTGTDWFTRSGSMMGLIGAMASFRLTSLLNNSLVTALREDLGSLQRGFELVLDPPKPYQRTTYFSYLTGTIGIVIWGYGDVLSRWVSKLLGN
jgi:hypothetical protein